APPIGPALGQHGVNIMEFCKQFNAKTQKMEPGLVIPVLLTVYQDKSFTFILKTPPVSVLIKKELGLAKGSAVPHKDKVGRMTPEQVEKTAKMKLTDLNVNDLSAAVRTVEGTARSMGVDIKR